MNSLPHEEPSAPSNAWVDVIFRAVNAQFRYLEKLSSMNLALARTTMTEQTQRTLKGDVNLSADPQAFFDFSTRWPAAVERLCAWHRQCIDIALAAQASLAEEARAQTSEETQQIQKGQARAAAGQPSGADAMVAVLNSFFDASRSFYGEIYKDVAEPAKDKLDFPAAVAKFGQPSEIHAAHTAK